MKIQDNMLIENSKQIQKIIVERFKSMGFKKNGYDYYKEWKPGVYVGIGESSFTGYHVNCRRFGITVCILHEEVEAIISRLTNRDTKQLRPTLSIQLGYLMPEKQFKTWEFSYGDSNDEVFSDMFNAIDMYAYPFWDRASDIDNLFSIFLNREVLVSIPARETVLPILYYLRGEKDKGLQIIEEAIVRRQRKKTDEEIQKESIGGDAYIIRAGEGKPHTKEEWNKMLKERRNIIIVGSGVGKVSQEYLDFKERYMQLE